MHKLKLDNETITEIDDKELTKLGNVAWFDQDMELQFMIDRELSRRRQQIEIEDPPE